MNVMVLEGTDRWTLNRAVGHIESTALPGRTGNVGISAHRDGFFRKLEHIRKGDEILIVTIDETYTYKVESTQVVDPTDTHVLAASRKPVLTLVTCFPFYFIGEAPQRFIVKAQLVQ
jgi:sortase A